LNGELREARPKQLYLRLGAAIAIAKKTLKYRWGSLAVTHFLDKHSGRRIRTKLSLYG
jgi:hypothetical protein